MIYPHICSLVAANFKGTTMRIFHISHEFLEYFQEMEIRLVKRGIVDFHCALPQIAANTIECIVTITL